MSIKKQDKIVASHLGIQIPMIPSDFPIIDKNFSNLIFCLRKTRVHHQ
jgi:hypothetical protein